MKKNGQGIKSMEIEIGTFENEEWLERETIAYENIKNKKEFESYQISSEISVDKKNIDLLNLNY